jgi:hypothetical protein
VHLGDIGFGCDADLHAAESRVAVASDRQFSGMAF